MLPTIAYLSDAKLFVKAPGAEARLVQSQFAQEMIDRANRDRQRNEWKGRGQGWQFSSHSPLFAASQNLNPETRRIHITGLCAGGPGELLYALDTDTVGGLFQYEMAADSERRLFHRREFRARDLARHPSEELIALSLRYEDGTANVALVPPNGKGLRDVTEGDSIDEAPAWVPSPDGRHGQKLVFQSAGVGRNAAGQAVALGPYAIQRLNLDTDEFDTLIEDERTDYLLPRMAADGTLYYIQRPWQPNETAYTPLRLLMDIVLFPYRLARAIVHFLNFFSIMFAGKPLMTAGGPPREEPSRYLMFWGKWIDTEKALRKASSSGTETALVPKTWQLIRRRPDGQEEVIADAVLSYDIAPDGSIVYTNGQAIYLHGPDGLQTVCTGKLIERVVVAASGGSVRPPGIELASEATASVPPPPTPPGA